MVPIVYSAFCRHNIRITSYNVCYTKLLRIINAAVIFMPPVQPTRLFVVSISTPGIIIALYFAFRKKFIKSVYSFIIMVAVALIAGAFLNGGVRAPAFIGLLVPLVYLGWICRSRNIRITSYNVCYTKLLRVKGNMSMCSDFGR